MEEWLGKPVADALTEEIKEKAEKEGITPKLVILRIGARPDDLSYEKGALARMKKCGFEAEVRTFPKDVSQEEFEQAVDAAGDDPDTDGILLFFPLPKSIDQKRIAQKIRPEKDLDGISPVNQAKLYAGDKSGFAPCTAEAVMRILSYYKVDPRGKKAVVVGRSTVIGRPAAMLLLAANATVTITHTKTADLAAECRQADILVAAAGHTGTVRADFIKPGAVVLDVGINVDENGKLCGDVDAQAVRDEGKASALTPVPRGVGSVTTSVLAEHLLRAAEARRETK
ncbi:MAG: bifunctional 5,10-methylenetetrahydrofolate dehydrogenase/5,10-methenyltetrahydrofolate cyclohydrolase [Lachnospiraceae bacterium]|jgi:methylenetetrahydrofolate dehydrogenase (NADP+)/methenyltetrahydrofolate cyclohydrolase|nr:bifunctional 5,10-methylenetetrahydrofolate dehydrogenase/5,10-methenyltetrahydrofolate cyclohydrolase [Lachnospiraceae bacterium]MCH4069951.1 bifunctional 5,10-methylenetetrahydrofolate dehydrogenase/5,10-methenyltetrahydrofolate cyclohydrolase [Lachnospiraceae bacterium]MCH4108698.1 bifunctional 5,10-methylenetetrahydrofolate dehydrogenase/5,10-methenyltetrahydrofolate cyclohydrolase [Lachnospiraceae bacterium]MCI1303242.1 bifunctional 5,10-methylenetetrahydrofolate dehydrogenase/5,10-methe